jgi:hypothetical protein
LPEAQESLRRILDDRQIDFPMFMARSKILERLERVRSGNTSLTDTPKVTASNDPDFYLEQIKTMDDVEGILDKVEALPPEDPSHPLDWSQLTEMEKMRQRAVAGLPFTLDLRRGYEGTIWGQIYTQVVAREYLAILPYYFGTNKSDPPEKDETLIDYLDRLSESANNAGDLALLQRVVAVKIGLTSRPDAQVPNPSVQQFLAGLSEDAGGQYVAAVVSYDKALKDSDGLLPVKIVGDRLAFIKESHPEDYAKGTTIFLMPETYDPFPNMQAMARGPFAPPLPPLTVLSIPMVIAVPTPTPPPGVSK